MRLTLRAGHLREERCITALGDRVAVAETQQERLVERRQHFPRSDVVGAGRIVGARRHECREDAGAGLERVVGIRGVVAGDRFGREVGGGGAVDQESDVEHRGLLRELLPGHEGVARRPVTGGKAGVPDRHPGVPVGVEREHPQSDEPAPVLPEERDVTQVEVIEQQLAHPLDVAGVGVVALLGRLVAAPESHQVGGDHPVSGGNQRGDHVAVQVAPRWLAVHQQDRRGVGRPLVEVVHPQRAAFAVGDVGVVRFERIPVESVESIVRCAQRLHGHVSSSRTVGSVDDDVVEVVAEFDATREVSGGEFPPVVAAAGRAWPGRAGPARCGSTIGLPVPSNVISILTACSFPISRERHELRRPRATAAGSRSRAVCR